MSFKQACTVSASGLVNCDVDVDEPMSIAEVRKKSHGCGELTVKLELAFGKAVFRKIMADWICWTSLEVRLRSNCHDIWPG